MPVNQINPPFPTFNDQDGYPLNGGYIYIGQPGFEAQSTPKASFFDVSMTIPTGSASGAAVRVNGGYAVYNGAPSLIYADGPCSITVKDQNDVLIFSTLNYDPRAGLGIEGVDLNVNTFTDLIALISAQVAVGAYVLVKSLGVWYQRVASGGHLTHTASVLAWNVIPATSETSIRAWGALSTGAIDNTSIINSALALGAGEITVPVGNWRVDGMIELSGTQKLRLEAGAALRRYSANSASTDPVVWLKGSQAVFTGAGQASSFVWSENRSPKGVVRLGHKDMTESHANVSYCVLRDMTISGAIAYGQTTGAADVALYMPNPEIGGIASYFHDVSGLRLQNTNIGMHLHGWANGNLVKSIQGINIGNTTLSANDANTFILVDGALDNVIHGAFFHASPNSKGLVVRAFDNTATPGGSLHQPYASTYTAIVCEQGGASAIGLKVTTSSDSYFEVRHNVAGGNSLHADFYNDGNVFFGLGADVQFKSLRADSGLIQNRVLRRVHDGTAGENVTKNIFTLPALINTQGAVVRVDLTMRNGVLDRRLVVSETYALSMTGGTLTATLIGGGRTGTGDAFNFSMAGGIATGRLVTFNNGTATTNTYAFSVEMLKEAAFTGTSEIALL